MRKINNTTILASFATLKSLTDAKQYTNSYQILAEFISHIIKTKNLYVFTAVEMKHELEDTFGFDIPEAVVKTASKSLPFVTRENGAYTVDRSGFAVNKSFEETKVAAEKANLSIIDMLVSYVKKKNPQQEIDEDNLTREFIAFLLEDSAGSAGRYTDIISEFILKHEKDAEIQKCLQTIQEGSILYIGLNYNVIEIGSITKNLTIFLTTEVLFSLVGFNGEIHKQLAQDFFAQIRNANLTDKRINLRYFPETKREIDSFFTSAEYIVEGKMAGMETVAMKAIVNHCENASDVAIKKSDFYHTLQHIYGIIEDNRDDYYAKDKDIYNLEGPEHEDSQEQEGWKFVSHINKLKKGKIWGSSIESEYLLVTNTKSILQASREQVEQVKRDEGLERVGDYAVSVERMTNLLWYKLGNGFGGKNYPSNVNVALKARVVLASSISHSISEVYGKTREQYKSGEITEEQLAARIITLRQKTVLPEELEGDSIDDSMDFSLEYLSRFEEEVKTNKKLIEEQNAELQRIRVQGEQQKLQLTEQTKRITEQSEVIQQKSIENERMALELNTYREKEVAAEKRKKRRQQILRFIFSIAWKVAIIAILVAFAIFLDQKVESPIPVYVCAAINLLSIIIAIWTIFKKDIARCFPKDK